MLPKLIGTLCYLAVLITIGIIASRFIKDIRDYFAAGKRLGYWAAAFSARATGVAVSLWDKKGAEKLSGMAKELKDAARR